MIGYQHLSPYIKPQAYANMQRFGMMPQEYFAGKVQKIDLHKYSKPEMLAKNVTILEETK